MMPAKVRQYPSGVVVVPGIDWQALTKAIASVALFVSQLTARPRGIASRLALGEPGVIGAARSTPINFSLKKRVVRRPVR